MKNNEHQEMTKEELQQIRGEFRTELQQGLFDLEQRVDQKMDQKLAKMEAHIVRWIVGVFLSAVVVMSTLVGTYTMMIAGKV